MAGKLLIFGFVLLLASGIALLRFVHSGSATPSIEHAKAPEPEGSDPAPRAADSPAAGSSTSLISKPYTTRKAPPSIAEAIALPPADEIHYRADGVPIAVADLDVLRAASIPTDDLVRACTAKHGGKAVTGTLITTYVIARKREKDGTFSVQTESTGYEEEGSTLTDPDLIDCLVKTANDMKWPPSTSPVATWARRRIVIENGILGENWVLKHGYIR